MTSSNRDEILFLRWINHGAQGANPTVRRHAGAVLAGRARIGSLASSSSEARSEFARLNAQRRIRDDGTVANRPQRLRISPSMLKELAIEAVRGGGGRSQIRRRFRSSYERFSAPSTRSTR